MGRRSGGVDRGMSASGFQLSFLRDDRLAPLATSALPAWLWSTDATRILWANPIGAAIFGAPTSAAISASKFDADQPTAAQIARLADTLSGGASPRLERLRGFGEGVGRALTCACSQITLADNTSAILVVAAERVGPDLPLAERVDRLLAGSNAPVAAFAADGKLLHATGDAQTHLRGATSLAALGAQALAADALASGHAAGSVDGSPVAIDRIGGETTMVLIADFGPPRCGRSHDIRRRGCGRISVAGARDTCGGSSTAGAARSGRRDRNGSVLARGGAASSPQMPAATERRHPLRFVWQMSEDGRFTLGSDEFIALIGPRTAAANRAALAGDGRRARPRPRGSGRARHRHP